MHESCSTWLVGKFYLVDLERQQYYLAAIVDKEFPSGSGNWQFDVNIAEPDLVYLFDFLLNR